MAFCGVHRIATRKGARQHDNPSSLFLATMLAPPAMAWESHVTVTARCLDGKVRVHYIVESDNRGDEGTVDVSSTLNGETVVDVELPDFSQLSALAAVLHAVATVTFGVDQAVCGIAVHAFL